MSDDQMTARQSTPSPPEPTGPLTHIFFDSSSKWRWPSKKFEDDQDDDNDNKDDEDDDEQDEPFLSLAGATVPAIDIQISYKYLGIQTGAGWKVGEVVTNKLEEALKQLSQAPLKLEQRLFLRIHLWDRLP